MLPDQSPMRKTLNSIRTRRVGQSPVHLTVRVFQLVALLWALKCIHRRSASQKRIQLTAAHPVDAAVVQQRPPLSALQQLPCAVHAGSRSRSRLAGGMLQACAAREPADTARHTCE